MSLDSGVWDWDWVEFEVGFMLKFGVWFGFVFEFGFGFMLVLCLGYDLIFGILGLEFVVCNCG